MSIRVHSWLENSSPNCANFNLSSIKACRSDGYLIVENGARLWDPRIGNVPVFQIEDHRTNLGILRARCERKALRIGRLLVINAESCAKTSEVTAGAREEYSDNED